MISALSFCVSWFVFRTPSSSMYSTFKFSYKHFRLHCVKSGSRENFGIEKRERGKPANNNLPLWWYFFQLKLLFAICACAYAILYSYTKKEINEQFGTFYKIERKNEIEQERRTRSKKKWESVSRTIDRKKKRHKAIITIYI